MPESLTPPEQNRRNWEAAVRFFNLVKAALLDPDRLWRQFVTWPVVSTFVVLGIGSGIGVLSMSPPVFLVAKSCFIGSAIIFWLKVAHWLVNSRAVRWERMILAFLIFGVSGVALVEAWKWISRNEHPIPTIDELLKIEASINDLLYPTGTIIGGIPWQDNLIDVRLTVITGPRPIQNFDLHIKLNEGAEQKVGIAAVKETSGIPCIFVAEVRPGIPSLGPEQLFGEVKKDKFGNRIAEPARVAQIVSPMYRVQCTYLQRNSVLKLIVAAASTKLGEKVPRRFPTTITTFGSFEINTPNGVLVHEFKGQDELAIAK